MALLVKPNLQFQANIPVDELTPELIAELVHESGTLVTTVMRKCHSAAHLERCELQNHQQSSKLILRWRTELRTPAKRVCERDKRFSLIGNVRAE